MEGARTPMTITIYGLGWRRLWVNKNQSIYNLYNIWKYFYVPQKKRLCHFMLNLHETSKIIFWGKNKKNKIINLTSAELAQRVVKVNKTVFRVCVDAKRSANLWFVTYSRLLLSGSPMDFEILRDIRISTYQICRIKEKSRTTTYHKWICNLTPEVRDILKILWKRREIAP